MFKNALLILGLAILCCSGYSQNRYWIASSSSNWNNASNWSTSSGGSGGASVPTSLNRVYFNSAGPGVCILDTDANIEGLVLTNYPGSIDINSNTIKVSGSSDIQFDAGDIADSGGNGIIQISTTGYVRYREASVYDCEFDIVCERLSFSGGIFNDKVTIEVIGAATFNGEGGCTFNDDFKVTQNGSAHFLMSRFDPDIFNGTVELINTGTADIRMSHSGVGNEFNDDIIVSSTGGAIYFGENDGTSTLAVGKTISIGAIGFTQDDLGFENFTQLGATPINLNTTGTNRITILESVFNAPLTTSSPRVLVRESTFNSDVSFTKTGSTTDSSTGGNTFNGDAELHLTGDGTFQFSNTNPDTFNGDLIANNNGSGTFHLFQNSAGNYVAGDLTLINDVVSTGRNILVGHSIGSSITIDGDVYLENRSVQTTSHLYFSSNCDCTVNGDFTAVNLGTGDNNQIFISNSENGNLVINGNSTIETNEGLTNKRIYVGNSGDVTFNGETTFENNSDANNSQIYIANHTSALVTFNGNILFNSGTGTDGIHFGNSGGISILEDGFSFSEGPEGIISGDLRLYNFRQVGLTVSSISLSGTSRIQIEDAIFEGDLTVSAPRIHLRNSTFESNVDFEKTGASNDASTGGNVFNGNTIFRNSGTDYFMPSNTITNDYNGDVSYIQTGTGRIHDSHACQSTYSGDLYFNIANSLDLANGSGRMIFDGTTTQSINDMGSLAVINLRRISVENSAGLTLNTPIRIKTDLNFVDGIINTSSTNFLRINNNGTVTGASNSSYVSGPVLKAGNDAFEFPIGKNGVFRPLSISAPTSSSAIFSAEYFDSNPNDIYSITSKDASIHHLSSTEYWELNRLATGNDVRVTLSWDDPESGGVTDLNDLLVSRWDGSQWKDHGNLSTTGTMSSGTITSNDIITTFSPFTLGSTSSSNPLPIELLSFYAEFKNSQVEIKWATAAEINNDYFEVERSQDGEDWTTIVTIDGAGNSNETIFYRSIDFNPLQGLTYYRLKQTDFDGTFSYSEVSSVHNLEEEQEFEMYPNPSFSDVKLVFSENAKKFRIYSPNGQIVHQQELDSFKTEYLIPLTSFKPGVYLVKVKIGETWKTKKMIKSQ